MQIFFLQRAANRRLKKVTLFRSIISMIVFLWTRFNSCLSCCTLNAVPHLVLTGDRRWAETCEWVQLKNPRITSSLLRDTSCSTDCRPPRVRRPLRLLLLLERRHAAQPLLCNSVSETQSVYCPLWLLSGGKTFSHNTKSQMINRRTQCEGLLMRTQTGDGGWTLFINLEWLHSWIFETTNMTNLCWNIRKVGLIEERCVPSSVALGTFVTQRVCWTFWK